MGGYVSGPQALVDYRLFGPSGIRRGHRARGIFIRGAVLGVVVLVALAALSLFRALCSIAGKDVQARTISLRAHAAG